MSDNNNMLIRLPSGASGALVADLLRVLDTNGYDAKVELAAIGRGKAMRINAVLRPPVQSAGAEWSRRANNTINTPVNK